MAARHHFSVAGIPVRVEPVFFLIAALFGLALDRVDLIVVWIVITFVSILVHELGHALALRAFGQPSLIVLHGFGGVTLGREALPRARSVVVSLAGSLSALVLLWLPARSVVGTAWYDQQVDWVRGAFLFTAFANLWWSVANLLPIRPLDGGNVATELLGAGPARLLSVAVGGVGGAVALALGQPFAAVFAFLLAWSNWQEHRRGGATGGAAAPASGALAPDRGQALAWQALRSGDLDGAERAVARVGDRSALDPHLVAILAVLGRATDGFDRLVDAYRARPSGPSDLVAAVILVRGGLVDELARRLAAEGRIEALASLQNHLHYCGAFAEAVQLGEVRFRAAPPVPAVRAQVAFDTACSAARAGDVDGAVGWLERAAGAGFRDAGVVDGEPDLAAVRRHPRWPLLRESLTAPAP